jgi:hypothetical protein
MVDAKQKVGRYLKMVTVTEILQVRILSLSQSVVPLRKELSHSREGTPTRNGKGLISCYNTEDFSSSLFACHPY